MTYSNAVGGAGRILRRVLDEDSAVFGGWLVTPSPEMLSALSNSALDYVGIDCQHGRIAEQSVIDLLVDSPPSESARVVRVSANRHDTIGRVADAGADAIIVPAVDDAHQASAAVAAIRFPPLGIRSYGPIADYLPREPQELSDRVLTLPMIETAAGLDAVDDILAVPGVHGVYVGPADLGISLGLGHRQFPADSDLEIALRRIAAAGARAGKIAGIHAGSELFAARYLELGFRLITLGIATSFVGAGVDAALSHIGYQPAEPRHGAGAPY